jgi:hypothetical protein
MRKKSSLKPLLEEKVMEKIIANKVIMKPRWYFVMGSFFLSIGVILLTILLVFLTNLIFFWIRKQCPGTGKLYFMLSNFPLWIPIMAVIGFISGIVLLKKYDFSYKKNFKFIVFCFISLIVITAFFIDQLGLNDVWSKRGPMKNLYPQQKNQLRRFINK